MMEKCPDCGAETRPGDHFCLNCGNRLTPSTPSPQQAQPAPGKETWTVWQLQQQLQSKNAETRRQAAEKLGSLKDGRAVDPLIAALTREARNWQVRHAVANALITLGDARTVPALVEVLQHDQDVFVQELAAETLMRIEGVPLEVLVLVLQAGRSVVGMWARGDAAAALGNIGDAQAVEPLIAALERGDKFEVLCNVIDALVRLGDARAVPALVSALNHWENVVQREAAWALGEIGDPRAVEPLVKALKETTHNHVRQAAAWALGEIGDPRAVEPLVSALQEATSFAQQTAATALGIIGDIGTVESVLEALHDRQVHGAEQRSRRELAGAQVRALNDVEDVMRSAAWALGKLRDTQAVDILIAALARNERSEALRGAVAQALGRIGDPRASALGRALEEDAGLRHTGFIAHNPAVALVGALEKNAEQEALRVVTVAEALGRIGDARAIESLVSVLQDKDGRVRQAAAEALTTLGWQPREDTSTPP